ncbi:MAG: hypothetical protein RIS79_2486 [Verrucomicrobiota bacterium]
MCDYSKPRHAALGIDLSLITAPADPVTDEHAGTEKGGMGQNGGMGWRLTPFAIFSSSILSSTTFSVSPSRHEAIGLLFERLHRPCHAAQNASV